MSNEIYLSGSGVTTSLIALIANAGPEDQAIATAGKLNSEWICRRH